MTSADDCSLRPAGHSDHLSSGQWVTLTAVLLAPPILLSLCWTYGTACALCIYDAAIHTDSQGTWLRPKVAWRLLACSSWLALKICPIWVVLVLTRFNDLICDSRNHRWYFPAYHISCLPEPEDFHIWMLVAFAAIVACAMTAVVVQLNSALAPCFIQQGQATWDSISQGRARVRLQHKWRLKVWALAQFLPCWCLISTIDPLVTFTRQLWYMHDSEHHMFSLVAGSICTALTIAVPTMLTAVFALVPNAVVFRENFPHALDVELEGGTYDPLLEATETLNER